jgi:hypothetical protein
MEATVLWNVIARISKILGALVFIAVGVWAYATESKRPLVTDAVINARLIEIFAPTTGNLTQTLPVGTRFLEGDVLARTIPVIAMPDDDFNGTDATPSENQAALEMLDLSLSENVDEITEAVSQPVAAKEIAIISETSGVIWHWNETRDAHFAEGDRVGFVADCTNLIAIGQIASAETSAISVGDPVIFVTQDIEWNGVVQRIVGGIPNMPGDFAIQFPVIPTDHSLVFFGLDGPAENHEDCLLGVPGQIHYPLHARRSPYEAGVAAIGDAKTIVYQTWDRVRTGTRSVVTSLQTQ